MENDFYSTFSNNPMLIWSICSFFLGNVFGIFIDELKQLYRERGQIKIIAKKIDLYYSNYNREGRQVSPMQGFPMLKSAKIHLSILNDSRRARSVRNIKAEGKIRNGPHFQIDFSQGKVPPSFVISQSETKLITIEGEFAALTDFQPFSPEDIRIELEYGLDSGNTKFSEFGPIEKAIYELPRPPIVAVF